MVLPHVVAVVGREDDERVVGQAQRVQFVEHAAELVVDEPLHAVVDARATPDLVRRDVVGTEHPACDPLPRGFSCRIMIVERWCLDVLAWVEACVGFRALQGRVWVRIGEPDTEGLTGVPHESECVLREHMGRHDRGREGRALRRPRGAKEFGAAQPCVDGGQCRIGRFRLVAFVAALEAGVEKAFQGSSGQAVVLAEEPEGVSSLSQHVEPRWNGVGEPLIVEPQAVMAGKTARQHRCPRRHANRARCKGVLDQDAIRGESLECRRAQGRGSIQVQARCLLLVREYEDHVRPRLSHDRALSP